MPQRATRRSERVIESILRPAAARRSVHIPPTLLVGPPGSAKTSLAERLFEILEVPSTTFDAAGAADAMIFGSSRKYTGAAPGLPLELVTTHRIGNPAIVIDELEKLGGSKQNGDLRQMLLGVFEPRRAAAFFDRHLEVPVNMSAISWICTANKVDGIPAPLLNRLRVLKCPAPGVEHLDALLPQVMKSVLAERGLDGRWYRPPAQDELELVRKHWRGGSIRDLKRYTEGILDARDQMARWS